MTCLTGYISVCKLVTLRSFCGSRSHFYKHSLVQLTNQPLFSCSQDVLEWRTSRKFFFWRLRRLLLENKVYSKIHGLNDKLTQGEINSMMRRIFIEDMGTVNVSMVGTDRMEVMICTTKEFKTGNWISF